MSEPEQVIAEESIAPEAPKETTAEVVEDPVSTDMRTKVAKIAFLVEHMGVPASEFEHMDIAQLSAQVKAVKQELQRYEEQQAIAPIIRPGEEKDSASLRENLKVGRVDLGSGHECGVDEILAYRGREVHPVHGGHQIAVINPKTGGPGIVTFEKRPDVWAREPVAIVRDWRIKAQVLYYPHVVVLNPTLGTQTVRVHARADYFLPLDLHPDKGLVEKMANFVRGTLSETDETERLTQAIAAEVFPK